MSGILKAMQFNRYANPSAKRRPREYEEKPNGPLGRLVELGLTEDVKGKGAA